MSKEARRGVMVAAMLLIAGEWASVASAEGYSGYEPCYGLRESPSVPGFMPAVIDHKPLPRYPLQALDYWSEGWVLFEHGVAADGTVKDLTVVDALGPKEFVTMAGKTLATWRYKPATRNGQPTEQFLYQASVTFLLDGSTREANHALFVRKYNRARAAIKEQKYDDAITILDEAFKLRLNLYEEAMGSFALAAAYSKKEDWPHALFHIRHSYFSGGEYLEKPMRSPALALLIEFLARDGSFKEALCKYDELKKLDPAAAADAFTTKIVAQIETALNNPAPLGIGGRLATHPLFDAPAVWRHDLLRRKFSFADVKGDVKAFRLACLGASHSGVVDAETIWTVPEQAGPCVLRVDGAPDATFTLVEEW